MRVSSRSLVSKGQRAFAMAQCCRSDMRTFCAKKVREALHLAHVADVLLSMSRARVPQAEYGAVVGIDSRHKMFMR